MEWKLDPNQLSLKILKRIRDEKEISYDDLLNIAIEHEIDRNIFDSAIARLHRSKKVKERVKAGLIMYRPAPVRKPVSPNKGSDWINKNYPYPEVFVMPFPEIDMSWIILRPEQMFAFRAKMKGVPVSVMKNLKKHENY